MQPELCKALSASGGYMSTRFGTVTSICRRGWVPEVDGRVTGGDTIGTVVDGSTVVDGAGPPNAAAICSASACVKLPLIATSSVVIPGLIVDAETTSPSKTIASCLPRYGRATFVTKSSFLKCTLTIHPFVDGSGTACAEPTSAPVSKVGPRM